MNRITSPSFTTETVLRKCAENFGNENQILLSLPQISISSANYVADFKLKALHRFPTQMPRGTTLSADDMGELYKNRFLRASAPGREYYDRIKSLCRICPFCGIGIVNTVDHYLPKTKFPILSVTPTNLIPCCRDCN